MNKKLLHIACSPQSRGASACLKVNGSTTMRPTQTPPPTQAPTPTRTSSLLLPSPISPRLKVGMYIHPSTGFYSDLVFPRIE